MFPRQGSFYNGCKTPHYSSWDVWEQCCWLGKGNKQQNTLLVGDMLSDKQGWNTSLIKLPSAFFDWICIFPGTSALATMEIWNWIAHWNHTRILKLVYVSRSIIIALYLMDQRHVTFYILFFRLYSTMNKLHSITEVKNQPGETAIPSFNTL